MLKKVKTEITYRVPIGHHCNLHSNPLKDMCRFCVKEKHGYRCALYNMPLEVDSDTQVFKTRDCERAMYGHKSVVEDIADTPHVPAVEPKRLIEATIKEYDRMRKELVAQGYPAPLAERLAKEYLVKG